MPTITVREPERDIEVLDQVDVLVAGGGVAGCAAALGAARAGARTALVERNGVLGGVATAGLMANIGNMFLDREGRLVVGGAGREVVERLVARGAASPHWASREVPGVVIDSEQLKLLLGQMLREAGVTVLTHVLAARPVVEGSAVRGAFVESKRGRQAIVAKATVDCTGEADLAWQAGCPTRWSGGTASVEFKMGRVDLEALYQHFRRHPETFPVGMDMVKGFAEFERNWVDRGIFFFPHGGGRKWDIFLDAIERGEFHPQRNGLRGLHAAGLYGLRGLDQVVVNSNFWAVESLDPRAVGEAELACQEACAYVADFFRRRVPGFATAYISEIASDIGIRVSRGVEGEATLRAEHTAASQPVRFPDAVGGMAARASFEHGGEFFQPHTFDIPYGILVPKVVDGLLVGSGKSVSCEPQRLIRGMVGCMSCGQAAGAAAALAASSGVAPRQLEVRGLQKTLLDQGALLGDAARLEDLGLA
ncbi:MAG: FAD-dependent oxidoreductase [Candidatus Brocadiia bacterium]